MVYFFVEQMFDILEIVKIFKSSLLIKRCLKYGNNILIYYSKIVNNLLDAF